MFLLLKAMFNKTRICLETHLYDTMFLPLEIMQDRYLDVLMCRIGGGGVF